VQSFITERARTTGFGLSDYASSTKMSPAALLVVLLACYAVPVSPCWGKGLLGDVMSNR
jgi:hypothetical protein